MRDKKKITVMSKLSGEDDFFQYQNREILSFTGSMLDKTPQTHRIAKLHRKITLQETNYQKKRRFIEKIGILSQWFDIKLLDRVSLFLEENMDRKEHSEEEEVKKMLAYLDVTLRLDGNTIRWKTLNELNEYFGFRITRKSLFKYRTEAHRALFYKYGKREVLEQLRKGPILLMKRLIVEYLISDPDLGKGDNEQKSSIKSGCFQIITGIKNLRYVPRDYEIYSYAVYTIVKKGLTKKAGKYIFPVDNQKMRRAISNATYNIKMKVIKRIWKLESPEISTENSQGISMASFL
jgi:hypothetical protein